MIKKNFFKKAKVLLLFLTFSLFLVACEEDKPEWDQKYINKIDSIFSDWDTYKDFKPNIETYETDLEKQWGSFSKWSFSYYLNDIKKLFKIENKTDFSNREKENSLPNVFYAFSKFEKEPEKKDNLTFDGYFFDPTSKKENGNFVKPSQKDFLIPVSFVFSDENDPDKIEFKVPIPPEKFDKETPYNFLYYKNLDDFFDLLVKSKNLDDMFDSSNLDLKTFNYLEKEATNNITSFGIKSLKFTWTNDKTKLIKSDYYYCKNALTAELKDNKLFDEEHQNTYNLSINLFDKQDNFNLPTTEDQLKQKVKLMFIKNN